ncbi:MAG TPA: hypothetical protein VF468_01335, partial [Actinomycetota bacterium]|nr:hypothetical protein [Actinomycetota bacterium]
RPVSAALVVVVALAGLLVTGRWLQPRLEGRRTAAATTQPLPTSPAPTSPTLATGRPAEGSSVTRVVATSSQVDAIAVTRQAVWLAVGGLVLRVDPATGRGLAVPGVEAGEPPVVSLTAGAGAVWAVTSAAGLLRIDPRTARLTASLPGPVSAVAAGAGGVWAVCCQGRVRRGRLTRLDPASGRVIAAVGLPGRPLAVGARPGAVWVRGAEGWLWRVDPARGRQAGAIRLPTVPDSAELPGAVVVAEKVVWVSDPGVAVVRRVDPRSGTEDRWEADGRDLAVTPGGMVWATSDTRLLGLGGPQVRGPRRNLHELGTDRITAAAAAEDGGLWLGTPQGLFHVDQSVLRQG